MLLWKKTLVLRANRRDAGMYFLLTVLILAEGWCSDQVSEKAMGFCERVGRVCLVSMKRRQSCSRTS